MPFVPGVSGNPGGRPRRDFERALRRMAELSPAERARYKPQDGLEELAIRALEAASVPTIVSKVGAYSFPSAPVLELIVERVDGKVPQAVAVVQVDVSADELRELLDTLERVQRRPPPPELPPGRVQ